VTVAYLTGPALETVRTLEDASVDLVACSPPFLALRDYNGVEGQWGSEADPATFLDRLLELAVECRRVLTPFGSLAFELGDTYSGSGGVAGEERVKERAGYGGAADRRDQFRSDGSRSNGRSGNGWPLAKSLTGVPTLFAWSLAYGRNLLNPTHEFQPWRVRNIIVWARSNPPVGGLGDKFRPATTYITVATPSDKRWFDLDAVRTPTDRFDKGGRRGGNIEGTSGDATRWREGDTANLSGSNPAGAPPLDHWTDTYDGDHTWLVNSQGSNLAHYAMWPAKLAERLVLSMCPAEVCRTCGQPRRRIVGPAEYAPSANYRGGSHDAMSTGERADLNGRANQWHKDGKPNASVVRHAPTLGWTDCGHNNYRPGHVLDPFAGTGTTLHAAEAHGRDATGIDLDPANLELVDRRRDEVRKQLLGTKPQVAGQLDLFGNPR